MLQQNGHCLITQMCMYSLFTTARMTEMGEEHVVWEGVLELETIMGLNANI